MCCKITLALWAVIRRKCIKMQMGLRMSIFLVQIVRIFGRVLITVRKVFVKIFVIKIEVTYSIDI